MTILLTGAAGFIGAYAARALLARGDAVIGIDNFNDYYDPQLKRDRVAALCRGLDLQALDIADKAALDALFARHKFQQVVHVAAQAGVRYSLKNPYAYLHSNWSGFLNMLEACRRHNIKHLVYASSSSVYGANAVAPFAETQAVDQPLSLYAASKASNRLMAHAYAHLYRIPCTGLRFFTVYGPWGRPDIAPLIFSRAILAGRPIGSCSITGACAAISPISTTSSTAWSRRSARRSATTASTRRMQSTISATTDRSSSNASSP
jgi:UDP-glucuronate 4-epimerase